MIRCEACHVTEFQLVRTESIGSVKYVDTSVSSVSEWIANDEPGYVEEEWTCVNGHVPDWEQDAKLTLIVTQDLLTQDLLK